MEATKHKTILAYMLNSNKPVTATDFKISNANQYLVSLEKMKLITRKWLLLDEKSRFKVAYFKDNKQKQKAKSFLEPFKKADEVSSKKDCNLIKKVKQC